MDRSVYLWAEKLLTLWGNINVFFYVFTYQNCALLKRLLFFRFHKRPRERKTNVSWICVCTFFADVCVHLILHSCIREQLLRNVVIKHPTLYKLYFLSWLHFPLTSVTSSRIQVGNYWTGFTQTVWYFIPSVMNTGNVLLHDIEQSSVKYKGFRSSHLFLSFHIFPCAASFSCDSVHRYFLLLKVSV